MRSNIARTDSAGSVPVPAAIRVPLAALAAQRGEEVDERLLLVLRHPAERRHRGGGVLQGAPDRALLELEADVGEGRAGTAVSVLADLVAGQAAGLRGDLLALLELGLDGHVDRVRRAGDGAHV